jgi:hypothetical protein
MSFMAHDDPIYVFVEPQVQKVEFYSSVPGEDHEELFEEQARKVLQWIRQALPCGVTLKLERLIDEERAEQKAYVTKMLQQQIPRRV